MRKSHRDKAKTRNESRHQYGTKARDGSRENGLFNVFGSLPKFRNIGNQHNSIQYGNTE
jgi:hypothetical protein